MKLAALLLLACGSAYAQYTPPPSSGGGGGGNPTLSVPNSASTGTTINTLTKLAHTSLIATAVIATAADTGLVVGITTAGAGTSGTATITIAGVVPCVFDNAPTSGDYLQISASPAGNCHDTGSATYPTSGQVIGRALITNLSTGTYNIDLFPSEIQAPSASQPEVLSATNGAFILPAHGETNWVPISGGWATGQTTQSCCQSYFVRAGTLSTLCLTLAAGSMAAGDTITATVYDGASATMLVATIPAGQSSPYTGCDNTHMVSVAKGDLISVAIINNDPSPAGYLGVLTSLFQ